MDVLILRLIHVVAAAFWVGAVFTNVIFLQRTAKAIGADAARFQYHLLRHGQFSTAVLASAIVTILAGIWLLWTSTDGLRGDLLWDSSRIGFTLGGIVAILTFLVGSLYVYPRTVRVVRTLDGPMTEGRPPTPDEAAVLGRLRQELWTAGWVTVVGVGLAAAAMATARYWPVVL